MQYIRIKNALAEVIRTFVLNYTYNGWLGSDAATVPVDCGNKDDVSLRLMLTEVAEIGSGNTSMKPPYKFSYFAGSLPARNSTSQDYWGYFNGVNNATLVPDAIIPAPTPIYTDFGTSRNPDIDYAKMGVLRSVEYPTGGYTTFEYEPNYLHPSEYIDLPLEIIRDQKVFAITTQEFSAYKETQPFSPGVDGTGTFQFSGSINCGSCQYIRWTLLKQQPNGTFISVWTGYDLTVPGGSGSITLRKDDVFKFSHEILVGSSIYQGAMSPGYSLDLNCIGTRTSQPLTMTGGLRISKITDHDPVTNVKNVRMFEYRRSSDTEYSGFILSSPKFYKDYYEEIQAESQNAPVVHGYYNLTSTNNVPLTTTQGCHVGYSEVCEYTGIEEIDDKFSSNGKIIYKYWAPDMIRDIMPTRDNNYQQYYGFPYANVIGQDWKRGFIKEQTVYSRGVEEFKEVKKTSYNYSFIDRDNPNANYSSQIGFKVGISTEYYFNGSPTRSLNYTKLKWGYYRYDSGYPILNSVVEKVYDQNDVTNFVETVTLYTYNLDNLKVAQEESHIGNEKRTTIYTYPNDYTDGSGFIKEMIDANIIGAPIEKVQYKEDLNNENKVIIGGQISLYDHQGKGHLEKVKSLESVNPILFSMFKFSNQQGPGTLPSNSNKTIFYPDDRYKNQITYTYDANTDKIISVQTKKETKQYIWGYNNTLPIAEVINASPTEIAYTGFEQESTGNWTVGTSYNSSQNFIGEGSYIVTPSNTISKSDLNSATSYVVSFWARSGEPTVNDVTPSMGQTINDWTYYEKTVTGTTSVTIAGNGVVDELRLYPFAAQMTTYTWSQGIGLRARGDVNSIPIFYEYDSLGRVSAIKDLKGSIVKTYEYNYQIK